jgi:hypothetical protein
MHPFGKRYCTEGYKKSKDAEPKFLNYKYSKRHGDLLRTEIHWYYGYIMLMSFYFLFFRSLFFFNIVLWGLNWRLIWSKLLTKSEIKRHGTKMKHVGKMNDVLESFCKIFTCLLPNIRCVVWLFFFITKLEPFYLLTNKYGISVLAYSGRSKQVVSY